MKVVSDSGKEYYCKVIPWGWSYARPSVAVKCVKKYLWIVRQCYYEVSNTNPWRGGMLMSEVHSMTEQEIFKWFKDAVESYDIRKDLKLKSYKAMHKNLSYMRSFNIVRDTLRGVPNAKLTWSYRRFKEEHDKMVKAQAIEASRARAKRDEEYAKRLKINFKDLHSWLEPIEFESGVKAVPLMNMQEVILEGSMMRHCVGSYAEWAARGEYVVWYLTKGDVEATLGINAQPSIRQALTADKFGESLEKYSFQQMYGKFNEILEDEDFKKAADWIVDKMNSSVKIQSNETQTGKEVEHAGV